MMLDIIVDGEESDNNEMNEAKVLGFQQRQKLSQRMKVDEQASCSSSSDQSKADASTAASEDART